MGLRPHQLVALTRKHGGLVRIATRPAAGTAGAVKSGWANTLECADGFRYSLTTLEERRMAASMRRGLWWYEDDTEVEHVVEEGPHPQPERVHDPHQAKRDRRYAHM